MVMQFSVNIDRATGDREIYSKHLEECRLSDLVREFLAYLDYKDESEGGTEFHPITISSCRVMMLEPLNMLLKELRKRVVT